MITDNQIKDSLGLVISIFREFRSDLLGAFGNVEFTRKSDKSVLTEWDVKVETKLAAALKEAFPDFGFEGEETGRSGNTGTYWLVDPIDATSSFIRGLPFTSNMAALVDNGKVIAAVVYDFVNDHLFTAIKGQGAYKDGARLSVINRGEGDCLVYALSSRNFPPIQEAIRELNMRIQLPLGAAGYFFTTLAEGKIDGIVAINTRMGKYDIAPGLLICEEAGAVVLTQDDHEGVERQSFIVGTPYVIETIEHSGLIV